MKSNTACRTATVTAHIHNIFADLTVDQLKTVDGVQTAYHVGGNWCVVTIDQRHDAETVLDAICALAEAEMEESDSP